jgi:hypothetical protein
MKVATRIQAPPFQLDSLYVQCMLSIQHGSIETVEPNETKTATDSNQNGFCLKFEIKMRVVCVSGFVLS